MDTEVIGFVFTEKCNFRCRHCFNESEPHSQVAMQVPEILVHIDAAAQTGRFREVGITGGEPMLFREQVKAIVAHAAARGLSSSITTNAFWAVSDDRARAALEPLVAAGLSAVNISVSTFHLEFARPGIHRRAAMAALELGLVTRVNVVRTPDFRVSAARALLGEDLADRVTFVPMPAIPAGRALESLTQAEFPVRREAVFGNCRSHFRKMAVTAEGEVFPCCSPGGFTPALRLGNLRQRPLAQIVAEMADSTLVQVLAGVGPAFFIPFIAERTGRNLLAEDFVDQCHLCHTILSDAQLEEVVFHALQQLSDELSDLHLTLAEIGGAGAGPMVGGGSADTPTPTLKE